MPDYLPPPDGPEPPEPADPTDLTAIMATINKPLDAVTAGVEGRAQLEAAMDELLRRDDLDGLTRVLAGAAWSVLDAHTPFRIFGECDHTHTDEDLEARLCVDIGDIGLTCEDAFLYSICSVCCMDDLDTGQREVCADSHKHNVDGWLCSTTEALIAALLGRV